METVKKYWWVAFVAPVLLYFVWEYIKSKNDIGSQMAKVREGKAIKAILKAEPETKTETEPEIVNNDGRTN